jgi:hypothetical protein
MRFTIAALILSWSHVSVSAQEAKPDAKSDVKIHTRLTVEQAEELLKKQGLEFKKVETKVASVIFYDFKRKGFSIRFSFFDGKDLMLDAVFPALPLERLNEWNRRAKFSRASLGRDAKGTYSAIESNIDLVGGVTDGGLAQFFTSFDEELRLFAKFVTDTSADDQLFAPVTSQKIEAVLKGLNIAYEKHDLKDGAGQYFDFEASNFKVRLINFGGKDLMVDAHFKKIPLEDVNRWNLEKKFIRAVSYSVKGMEYTALEMNLDCEAGTTDGIIRNFIVGFHEDVKQFAKYVQGK